MLRHKWFTPCLLTVFAAVLLAGCGGSDEADPTPPSQAASPASAEQAASFPVSVTDSQGTQIVFDEAPQRIISYSPGATEILFAIGAGERVVGVDQFANYPPEVESLPRLEYLNPAAEPAIGLDPDLVIMASQQEGQVEVFRAAGMKVLYLEEPADVFGVVDDVRLLGTLTGEQDAAEALATDMEARIAAIEARVAQVESGPAVFYELTPDLFTVGAESFIGSMLTLVKAINVAEDADGAFPQLSQETLLERDPEVILLADSGEYGGQTAATVAARPGWGSLRAVVDGRVHELNSDLYTRPGPRIVEALEELVTLLYPDL